MLKLRKFPPDRILVLNGVQKPSNQTLNMSKNTRAPMEGWFRGVCPSRRVWYGKITFSLFNVCDIERLHFPPYFRRMWYGIITVSYSKRVWSVHADMAKLHFSLFKVYAIWNDYNILLIQSVCDIEWLHYSPYSRRMRYAKRQAKPVPTDQQGHFGWL